MTRRIGFLVTLLALAAAAAAIAPPKPAEPAPLTEDQQKAQQHFQKAKELYAAGSYREAIAELEAARALDPKAKDLVYNLGIVYEKLAKYDEAITYFRQYMEMEGVTTAEKQKAESVIKRIEGAKREVPPTPSASASAAPPPRREQKEDPPNGRVDALAIGAGAAAVIGVGVGVGFGIRALATRPANFVTGRDGTFADLQSKNDSAHTSAIVSDVGFAVGVVSAVAAAYLYFGRTRDPDAASIAPAAAPTKGGGVVGVGGTFR